MKRTRHTAVADGFSEGVQIIRKLKSAEQLIAQGKSVADVCRVIDVTSRRITLGGSNTAGCKRRKP